VTVRIKPILFSGPMVQALLEGRKTQTRRLLKPQPECPPECHMVLPCRVCGLKQRFAVGDLLWVREAFFCPDAPLAKKEAHRVGYRADGEPGSMADKYTGWRSSLYMPRWASRLTLAVTDVRIQRLRQMTEADAEAEGFKAGKLDDAMPETPIGDGWTISSPGTYASAAGMFLLYWQELHPDWDGYSDPWVVALTFTVHKLNIDEMPKREAA
jgi:hypothetical protein